MFADKIGARAQVLGKNRGIFAKQIRLSEYRLEAQVRIGKSEIAMEGDYHGGNCAVAFRMSLKSNGFVWFELNRKGFRHPELSSSAAEFRGIVASITTDAETIKSVLFKIWDDYDQKISERTMVAEKVPYNKMGMFNFYLDGTMNLGSSITGSKVTVEEGQEEDSISRKLSSPFKSVYRKFF